MKVINGDCRDAMKGLADCSVDSIVTDPPYELGFMGKGWDRSGIAYDVNVWLECLRVLKPGGYLLAFGGSRTYHRLACAIEDAGFEIRDQIQWIYASGFPKSLNVSDNLREQESVCTCNETSQSTAKHNLRSMSDSDVSPRLYAQDQSWQILQPSVSEQGPSERRAARGQSQVAGCEQSSVEGRRDGVQEEGQLHGSPLCACARVGKTNGPQGRVCNGTPTCDGPDVRVSSHPNGSSEPSGSQAVEQCADQSGTVADERGSQAWRGWPICPRCRKPIFPEGIGSALKPAHEPIVVARKPFNSTLIENVLKYGTGGLNIDGCRIDGAKGDGNWNGASETRPLDIYEGGWAERRTDQHVDGRWPSNVIHDGSEEVLAGFPNTTSGDLTGQPRVENKIYGSAATTLGTPRYYEGDTGSAARYFYCAKASKEDREEGLDDLPIRSAGEVTDRKDGSDGLNSPRAGAGRTNGSRNHHPTVKPTDLMRYLCRLVTPPGGTVLDPFCGSGSTGKAAVMEGLDFIGIELSAEYCELAEKRIEAASRQGLLFREAIA